MHTDQPWPILSILFTGSFQTVNPNASAKSVLEHKMQKNASSQTGYVECKTEESYKASLEGEGRVGLV